MSSIRNKRRFNNTVIKKNDTSSQNGEIVLAVGALVLLLTLVFVVFMNNNDEGSFDYSQIIKNQQENQSDEFEYDSNDDLIFDRGDDFTAYLNKLNTNIKTVWEHQAWTQDRLALNALVTNHNAKVDMLNRPKSEKIILYNDWTLSGFPNLVVMSEEDKKFIRKFIRN